MNPNRRKRLGTLARLFVGIGIAGTVAAGVPAVDARAGKPDPLLGIADRIAAEVDLARSQAAERNEFLRLRFEGDRIVRERSIDGIHFAPDGVVLNLPSGVTANVAPTKDVS